MKYKYHDIFDGECTSQQYADQYPSIIPEVGKIYSQMPFGRKRSSRMEPSESSSDPKIELKNGNKGFS